MATYHIHIKGLVQGVGFRPHVYRLARQMKVTGWVNNTTNGVHIMATADEELLEKFYRDVVDHPPPNARIKEHHAELVSPQEFLEFHIQTSENSRTPDLWVTPDFGLCERCRNDLFDEKNRRYRYPFTTCTDCGPRYSIIEALPYDREQTTMAPYEQCWKCREEYHDPANRRYFSQTNSCEDCGIPMKLISSSGELISEDYEEIFDKTRVLFSEGKLVAVKGVGGYLLMCDATNEVVITALRNRKHRPSKPFALLYPDLETVNADVVLTQKESEALQFVAAPIVLCRLKEKPASGIRTDMVAPGLSRVGIMLPYSPLLAMLAADFGKPMAATSGNVSGSPILFGDEEALHGLLPIADYILSYEREIVVPQDDSVIQFSKSEQRQIILRRSRGLAPNYFPAKFSSEIAALAMGAELKSSFALLENDQCYISQYLGDAESFEAQNSYRKTLQHLIGILKFEPDLVLVDPHPGYQVSLMGRSIAQKQQLPVYEVQHHKAHFAAVLAENDLIESHEPVLGMVWDGTGYGEDGNIWGGEFFMYEEGEMNRVAHLDYFPVIAGDKMAREPRLSALSLLHGAGQESLLREKFTEAEWSFYQSSLAQDHVVETSSMGRFLDGVASLLDICDRASYEGEAAMLLEAAAADVDTKNVIPYGFEITNSIVHWQPVIVALLNDIANGLDKRLLAYKIHLSLARLIADVAAHFDVKKIAFSGGVFQNALLNDLVSDVLEETECFFHQLLSPNDECIGFGQLAFMHITEMKTATAFQKLEFIT
ncbi:MAG: carbamoyltransferase HypF [Flavisolibacter sp.]